MEGEDGEVKGKNERRGWRNRVNGLMERWRNRVNGWGDRVVEGEYGRIEQRDGDRRKRWTGGGRESKERMKPS